MPYYIEKKALSPLSRTLISEDRLKALLKLSVNGFSTGLPSHVRMRIRHNPVDDYKGFHVPVSISFGWSGREDPTYHLIFIGDEVDARVSIPSGTESPWIAEDQPSLDSIEDYWKPIQHADEVKNMLEVFEIVEKHALAHHYDGLTEDEKLKHIKREDVNLQSLYTLCKILGAGSKEASNYIEDHVIFSAYNPHNYLKKNNLLEGMTLDQCQHFSWRNILYGGNSYFRQNHYLCELDWKIEAADVSWNINALASARRLKTFRKLEISQEEGMYSTEHYLDKAAAILAKSKTTIAFIDELGDSYLFTLLENRELREFVKAGQELDLDCSALAVSKQGGWLKSLFS